MPFDPLTGTGPAGAYLRTDPKPGQQTWNQVRLNFDDHEERILDLEGGLGTGDVVGPSVAINNEICRFDLETGKLIQGSGIQISDGQSGEFLEGTNTGDVTLTGTPDYITISGQTITRGSVDLAADVTGRITFPNLPAATGKGVIGAQLAGDYQRIQIGAGLDIISNVLVATSEEGDGTGLIPGQYGNATEFDLGNLGTALTVDWDNSNQQHGILDDNCTLTIDHPTNSNARDAHRYALILEQDGTGGHSLTLSGVLWVNGEAPDTSLGAPNEVYLITLLRTAAAGGTFIGSWAVVE